MPTNSDQFRSMQENRSLNIAMIIGTFPNYSETFVSRKVDYLLEQGHDVHVFCRDFNSSLPGAQAYRGRVHVVKKTPKRFFKRLTGRCVDGFMTLMRRPIVLLKKPLCLFSDCNRLKWAAASFLAQDWDVVHCHYLVNMEMLQAIVQDTQSPVIVSIYGYDVTVFPFRSERNFELTHQWLRLADGLTYSSEFLRRETRKLDPANAARECIVWPETLVDFFSPIEKKKVHQPYRILSVGRLHWSKGYPFALKTMALLKDKGIDFQYRMIGEGAAREELEYGIRSLGLADQVILEGIKTTEEVREAMRWADVFFLPSVRESFGSVLVEAQASGLPVIASRIDGTEEAVEDGKTALLSEVGNPAAFADALGRLFGDPVLFERMSSEGPLYARKYDRDGSGKKLEQFYHECICACAEKKNVDET